jgi:Fic family protein
MAHVIQYVLPTSWVKYEKEQIQDELLKAKAHILALQAIPFQRRWVKELQDVQLKLEVGGSSQIEGADFAANELDAAIRAETPGESFTRSQKQAHALSKVYKWIATLGDDMPTTVDLICDVHRRIVTDCDEDHCPPGQLRIGDHEVVFGVLKHRGALAGEECASALQQLTHELQTTFRAHDPLVQALALHYHFAAMHPFIDGNGRTARALEALALQRAGLRDSLFIAMSNYYYEEKHGCLAALAEVRKSDHNLTPFLLFGLKGIAMQTGRLTSLIRKAVSKEIFRNLMHELFARLESARKRVIVKRQLMLLERLLEIDGDVEFYEDFVSSVRQHYASRRNPVLAIIRDMNRLISLQAVKVKRVDVAGKTRTLVSVNMDWPATITETEFFARLASLPKSKTSSHLLAGD